MFIKTHFYTCAFNDKLRDFEMLKVLEENGQNSEEWICKRNEERVKIYGAAVLEDVSQEWNANLCFRSFFK